MATPAGVAACGGAVTARAPISVRFSPRRRSAVAAGAVRCGGRPSATVTAMATLPGRGGGAGVLERPGLDRSNEGSSGPSTEEGGDMAKLNKLLGTGGGNRYRVLLLDHERHTEDRVARALPAAVPVVTPDEARRIFHESRDMGAGLVTLALKEHAEFYAQSMAMQGLRSTIQPDGQVL